MTESACFLCEHHYITTLLLNSIGLTLLLLVLVLFFGDFWIYCFGQNQPDITQKSVKLTENAINRPQVTLIQNLPAPSSPILPFQVPFREKLPSYNHVKDINYSETKRFPTAKRPSPMVQVQKRAGPGPTVMELVLQRQKAVPAKLPSLKNLTPGAIKPRVIKGSPLQMDMDDDESTGSTYYKQMVRGKKPIHSFSQYLTLLKPKKEAITKQVPPPIKQAEAKKRASDRRNRPLDNKPSPNLPPKTKMKNVVKDDTENLAERTLRPRAGVIVRKHHREPGYR